MFKFADRNKNRNLVLITGWAFDEKIFASLDMPFNYIYYCGEPADDFSDALKKFLDTNNIKNVSLLGWSLGSFMACHFAAANPQFIQELILVAARENYDKDALAIIKNYLTINKKVFMRAFYKECFSPDKESYHWFRDTLQKDYIERFSTDQLTTGLNWLANAKIDTSRLQNTTNLKIVHGMSDSVVPLEHATAFAAKLPYAKLIVLENAGHIPFLSNDFANRLYE